MKKKYMVIGLGRFGETLARELTNLGAEVMAIDRRVDVVNRIAPDVAIAVSGDATNRDFLIAQNARQMDCAVVALGEHFESMVLATALLSELGVPLVIARASSLTERRILERVGAHQIFMPLHDMAQRLARSIHLLGVIDFIELPTGYCLQQIAVPDSYAGHTLAELSMRQKARVMVIRIKRDRVKQHQDGTKVVEPELIAIPDGGVVLERGDVLSLIGAEDTLEKFVEMI
jgi:trk system potassium uptake protein